ncbi:MAG: SMC-Scp complex subunit ScpB [Chrysiogenetes bacterium]|nr:SMC-Scp complex subunit ScpB [Chrysiogenetes bacterium]
MAEQEPLDEEHAEQSEEAQTSAESAHAEEDLAEEEAEEEDLGEESDDEAGGLARRLSDERLRSVIESLIFASPKPLALTSIANLLRPVKRKRVREVLDAIIAEGAERELAGTHGFVLKEVAGGYHYRTVADNAPWLKKLQKTRPWRLTQATLEVLAIVAYKQPITRGEVEQLRGVDSSAVMTKLIERRLIQPAGRKEVPGWPMMYATTPSFLEFFGLKTLKDLPTLREIKEITDLEDEVEVPEELRAFEEERRKQLEAEQDGLLEDDDEYERMAAERGEGEEAPEDGEASEDEEESKGVSFDDLSGDEDAERADASDDEDAADDEDFEEDDSEEDEDFEDEEDPREEE